jgi:recombination protein RecA
MPSAAHLRQQIEAALADRIPSALTPPPRVLRPTAPTGISSLDEAIEGGLPIGGITELTGPECSGRTSLALSFIARLTNDARVCAWVDVSDALHPESASAAGVDLNRLLWIRCGPEAEQLNLPGFKESFQWERVNPLKTKVTNDSATTKPQPSFTDRDSPPIRHDYLHPRCCEPMPKVRRHSREVVPMALHVGQDPKTNLQTADFASSSRPGPGVRRREGKPWSRLDQALRATDLLLQGGGFSAIVLDMGGIAPEFALRVPLATWFRYRAAAERTHASVLLLTQHPCSKSSASLVLHCQPSSVDSDSTTVFTGTEHLVEITRDRFARNDNLLDFSSRKPPQSDHTVLWSAHTPWSMVHPGTQLTSPRKAGRR